MTSFSTLQVIGRAVAASAILGAGLVFVPPAFAADDFPIVGDIHIPMPRILEDEDGPRPPPAYERPPVERPYYEERPYSQRPSAPGPYAAIPSSRYQRSTLGARPMLPPEQVVTVLRSSGYSPLGRVTQRGWIYTIAAIDRNGDDGRLIIDARTGQIMRFIPAQAVDERMMAVYGPPGPPPAIYAGYENRRGALLDLRNAPRPPGGGCRERRASWSEGDEPDPNSIPSTGRNLDRATDGSSGAAAGRGSFCRAFGGREAGRGREQTRGGNGRGGNGTRAAGSDGAAMADAGDA